MTSKLGHDPWIAQVLGGIARAQWLTTLTGESPTSSRTTLVAGRVTRADKAQPKRRVDAAVQRGPTRTLGFGDGSSLGVAATAVIERPNGRRLATCEP
jgi:hypothetical protein